MALIGLTTGASTDVTTIQSDFLTTAENAVDDANSALDALSRKIYVRSYSPTVGSLDNISINLEDPGKAPTWGGTATVPGWQNIPLALKTVEKTEVEDFTGDAPVAVSPNIPTAPTPKTIAEPGDAPTISAVTIPDVPTLSQIADPREWAINIPASEQIDIPEFTAGAPSMGGISLPLKGFSWNESPYTSQLLTDTVAQVQAFNQGGVGIPDIVWDALWARENDRESKAGEKLITEINEEWSSRGFTLPQGVQAAQVAEARQNLQSSASGRARDIAIEQSKHEIENLRFAVQQGIAMESMRGQWFQESLNRVLDATKYTYQLSIETMNAEIGMFNSQVQLYQIETSVYKTKVEAELSKLEVEKIELERQRLVGDLNLQQVEIYKTKVEALNIEIDRHNSILEGIKIGVEIDAQKIEAYRTETQAYGEKIKAVSTEYDLYKTRMEGAKVEADIYQTNTNAFATRVQAYTAKVDAESRNTQIDIDVNKQKLLEYEAKLSAYNIRVGAVLQEIKAETAAFDAEYKAYAATLDTNKARADVRIKSLQQDIAYASLKTQASIASANNDLKEATSEAELFSQGMQQVAAVGSSLAGSAMSAVNISQQLIDQAYNPAEPV